MTEVAWADIKAGDIYLASYPPEGGIRLWAVQSKGLVVQESEIPIIRETVKSLCTACRVSFDLISPREPLFLIDQVYAYTLYPCRTHVFRIAEIQNLVTVALKNNLKATEDPKLAYDPLEAWNFSAPLRDTKGDRKYRDLRDAKALGLKILVALWEDAETCIWRTDLAEADAYVGVTQRDKMGKLCGGKLIVHKRVRLPLCHAHYSLYKTQRDHLRNQEYYRRQTGVIMGKRTEKDDRHRR